MTFSVHPGLPGSLPYEHTNEGGQGLKSECDRRPRKEPGADRQRGAPTTPTCARGASQRGAAWPATALWHTPGRLAEHIRSAPADMTFLPSPCIALGASLTRPLGSGVWMQSSKPRCWRDSSHHAGAGGELG